MGRAGTAAHVERIVRGWRRVDRQAEARETARQHASRALHVHQDEDGMVVLRGRPDHALEPRAPLSPAPPRGSRGGLPGRARPRRRAPLPAAGRPAPARGPAPGRGARRSGAGPPGAARRAGAPPPCADDVPRLARGAPGSGLGDRRPASPGHTSRGNRVIASAADCVRGRITI